jgi:hypothetical protein
VSVPNETIRRLRRWGGWASGGLLNSALVCALDFINSGSRATADADADPEILRTDWIVGRAERPMRVILIRHYCTDGSGREKALRMGVPKSTYYDRLEEARWFVHTEYDKADALPIAPPDTKGYRYASVRVFTAKAFITVR